MKQWLHLLSPLDKERGVDRKQLALVSFRQSCVITIACTVSNVAQGALDTRSIVATNTGIGGNESKVG